jgi:hypothetical protein
MLTYTRIKALAPFEYSMSEGVAFVDHVEANLGPEDWRKLSYLTKSFFHRHNKKIVFYDAIILLVEAGYFVRVVPRTEHRAADALVSRLGFLVDREVAPSDVPRQKPDPAPRFERILSEFMDSALDVGEEAEVGDLYARFLVKLDRPDISHQVVSRQLDKGRYKVRSTTIGERRVRVVRRVA